MRTVQRAHRKQHAAAAAMGGAGEHPALGALNRHLNLLLQQVATAHRVIGRVAAERDALRQQLADLQGIPVEQIVVTSIGASADNDKGDRPARTRELGEPQPATGLARLNYFGHEDIDVARKRRQMFVLGMLLVVLVLGVAIRLGIFAMPDNVSRDSLAGLPFIGDFMAIFFAGWMFFRVFKVGTKGVKWVFPSEDQKRRRR
jgi:hypothetical protein